MKLLELVEKYGDSRYGDGQPTYEGLSSEESDKLLEQIKVAVLSEHEKDLAAGAIYKEACFLDECLEKQGHFLTSEEEKELYRKKETLLEIVEKLGKP
jgi:hypothetical protein